jgi:hypothetical protein
MQKEKAVNELAEARRQAAEQRALAAALFVEEEGPKFWKTLKEKLQIAVDALPVLSLNGSFSSIGPVSVRINMNQPGIFANITYTDIFIDQNGFRCTTLDDGFYNLAFCIVSENNLAVMDQQHESSPMNPEEASEYIIRRMIKLLRSRAH